MNHLRGIGWFGLWFEGHASTAATPRCLTQSITRSGYDTVRAANKGNARSQAELGYFHFISAMRLDMLQGASADDRAVAARWTEALRFLEMAAAQGKELW
jgi:hypothetical protein